MSDVKRDPFAPLGTIGNRRLQYGADGPIPPEFLSTLDSGVRLAYQLAYNKSFNALFQDTLTRLGVPNVGTDAYLNALEKMVVHLAETSKDARAVAQIKEDDFAKARDKSYQPPGAFSIVLGKDVWLRRSLLSKRSESEVAGALMHEAAHIAGAPGNFLAEIALERLGEASGYRRR